MTRIDAIETAISIIECCANTYEPEVNEALSVLEKMLRTLEKQEKSRRIKYAYKRKINSNN